MTEEAREFLRDEMRGDYEAMIAHQEREIKQLETALAEAEELIAELVKTYCPRCGARLEQ